MIPFGRLQRTFGAAPVGSFAPPVVGGIYNPVRTQRGGNFGKAEAILPKTEQVGDEELREGMHVKVYVVDVKETEKGPRVLISRTHPGLVKRLFEMQVPEIFDGTVEIMAVSREAG